LSTFRRKLCTTFQRTTTVMTRDKDLNKLNLLILERHLEMQPLPTILSRIACKLGQMVLCGCPPLNFLTAHGGF
jgi:hypothetical protein